MTAAGLVAGAPPMPPAASGLPATQAPMGRAVSPRESPAGKAWLQSSQSFMSQVASILSSTSSGRDGKKSIPVILSTSSTVLT